MQKEVISEKQMSRILTLFIIGSSLVLGAGTEAKQDNWISILIAMAAFLPILAVYVRLVRLYPQKGLFDIMIEVLGTPLGNLCGVLYVLYAILVGSLIMRVFSEFIHVVSFPETPQVVWTVCLTIFCGWMVKCGVESMARWAKIMVPIIGFIVIFLVVVALKNSNFENLKPVGGSGIRNIMTGAFSTFAFPLGESVLFLSLGASFSQRGNTGKACFVGVSVGILFILLATVRSTLLLGFPSLSMFYFPSYAASSVISLGNFFTRIEIVVSVTLLIAGAAKTSVCLFASVIGLSKLFHMNEYKSITFPTGLFMMTLSSLLFQNTLQLKQWINIYQYFSFPFQVIIPVLLWICAEIECKRKAKKSTS